MSFRFTSVVLLVFIDLFEFIVLTFELFVQGSHFLLVESWPAWVVMLLQSDSIRLVGTLQAHDWLRPQLKVTSCSFLSLLSRMNNLRQSRRSIKMNLVTGLHEWIMHDISRLPLPNLKVAI